eukprot:13018712-Ditylum_brightwellii.AAC.1
MKAKVTSQQISSTQTTAQHSTNTNRTSLKLLSLVSQELTVVHKFSQKYGFKGSWDDAGKLVKQRVECLELKGKQIANTCNFYAKLCKEPMKDGSQEEYVKLFDYEQNCNNKVLENTLLTTRHTFVALGTEYNEEYSCVIHEGNHHVICTDCQKIKDMKTIKGTQQFYQVQGSKEVCADGSK